MAEFIDELKISGVRGVRKIRVTIDLSFQQTGTSFYRRERPGRQARLDTLNLRCS